METIHKEETDFSTSLIMGERTTKIPGRYSPLEAPTTHGIIVFLGMRAETDYANAPCKHECVILKQSRHVRHSHAIWRDGTIVQ
jgi:hypothetical protein